MKLLFLLLLTTLKAFALECGDVPEGKVFRLDQENRSLSKAAIQDQDGLGTCFANQASLALQSIIPGNPNLSYLNLGLYYTAEEKIPENYKKGDYSYTETKVDTEGKVVETPQLWGGRSCATITAAINYQNRTGMGALCRLEDSNLEHSYFDEKNNMSDQYHNQGQVLTAASKYMNAFQKKFGLSFQKNSKGSQELQLMREKADNFSKNLKEFVNNSGNTYLEKVCLKEDPEKMETIVNNMLLKALSDNPKCIDSKNLITQDNDLCKTISNLGSIYPVNSNDKSNQLKYNLAVKSIDDFYNDKKKRMDQKTSFPLEEMQKQMSNTFKSKNAVAGFKSNFIKYFVDNTNEKIKPKQRKKIAEKILTYLSPLDIKNLESDFKRVALKDTSECKSEKMLDFFKDKDAFIAQAKSNPILCQYSELLENASLLVGVLPTKKFKDMNNILDFLTKNAGLNYDEGINSLIANDCTPDKRIKIPNIKCDAHKVEFDQRAFLNGNISRNAQSLIKENRKKILANLEQNRGVGYDFCTKFLKDPSYNFLAEPVETRQDTCRKSGAHGLHAVTMIGYRCKNNKLEYLAQNSYGPNWELDDKSYEIENGKIWLDEDKVFKNLDVLNFYTP